MEGAVALVGMGFMCIVLSRAPVLYRDAPEQRRQLEEVKRRQRRPTTAIGLVLIVIGVIAGVGSLLQ
jgi:hypothetical protein